MAGDIGMGLVFTSCAKFFSVGRETGQEGEGVRMKTASSVKTRESLGSLQETMTLIREERLKEP